MSSTIVNTQKILEAAVNAGQDLQIANPFTRIFTRQTPQVDMGSEEVTIELFKGNRKLAPLVSRQIGSGIDQDRQVIRPGIAGANDYLYALVSQDLEVPSSVLNKRVPGESPYVRGTDAEVKAMRQRYWMMKLAIDDASRILRKDESLAQQAYFFSEMDNKDGKLIFPRSASLKNRTVVAIWSSAANAKPWTDLGLALRASKAESQIDGSGVPFSTMATDVYTNLQAVYRNQRPAEGPDANMSYNAFNFDPDKGVPTNFQHLVDGGMVYGGWVRVDYGALKVHIFTLPEGHDSTADDSAETYVDNIAGETITVGYDSPSFFKAYFGPGILEPPKNNVVESAIGRVGIPQLGDLSSLTIGTSGIPAESMLLNIYELGRNQGFGATVEHAPIFAPKRPDVTVTIDTETTV